MRKKKRKVLRGYETRLKGQIEKTKKGHEIRIRKSETETKGEGGQSEEVRVTSEVKTFSEGDSSENRGGGGGRCLFPFHSFYSFSHSLSSSIFSGGISKSVVEGVELVSDGGQDVRCDCIFLSLTSLLVRL